MPDMISDADRSARNDQLSLSMVKSSTNVLLGENENRSQQGGGKIGQGA
jgi:hypothetical protein